MGSCLLFTDKGVLVYQHMEGGVGLILFIFYRAMMPMSNDALFSGAMMPVSMMLSFLGHDAVSMMLKEAPRPHPTPSCVRGVLIPAPFGPLDICFCLDPTAYS